MERILPQHTLIDLVVQTNKLKYELGRQPPENLKNTELVITKDYLPNKKSVERGRSNFKKRGD